MIEHPIKDFIRTVLDKHFAPEIAKRFRLFFEWDKYNNALPNIRAQLRDNMPAVEVYYSSAGGIQTYICDVLAWESPKQNEVKLLRHIADKVRMGHIGHDWEDKDGKVSAAITSGELETYVNPSDPLARLIPKKKGGR